MKIIEFKSTMEFYMKEMSGQKNNTVRFYDDDKRFKLLKKFSDGKLKELQIKIKCVDSVACFTRIIKDVSIYENIYIITWYE